MIDRERLPRRRWRLAMTRTGRIATGASALAMTGNNRMAGSLSPGKQRRYRLRRRFLSCLLRLRIASMCVDSTGVLSPAHGEKCENKFPREIVRCCGVDSRKDGTGAETPPPYMGALSVALGTVSTIVSRRFDSGSSLQKRFFVASLLRMTGGWSGRRGSFGSLRSLRMTRTRMIGEDSSSLRSSE